MRFGPFGLSGLPPNARARSSIIVCASLCDPSAVDRVSRAGYGRRSFAAEKHCKGADALRLGELVHRLLLGKQRDLFLTSALPGCPGASIDLLLYKRRENPARTDGVARDACVCGFHGDNF